MFEVVKTVRKRPQPSFFSASDKDAYEGEKFESDTIVTTEETISGVLYSVNWVQMPDGYWVPFNHYANENEVYVIEYNENPEPIPTDPNYPFPDDITVRIGEEEMTYVIDA